MKQACNGEVHFIDGDGINRIDFIDDLAFPSRGHDEKIEDFKERITKKFERSCHSAVGCKITAVKWSCPLGYHHGYINPHARAQMIVSNFKPIYISTLEKGKL